VQALELSGDTAGVGFKLSCEGEEEQRRALKKGAMGVRDDLNDLNDH
jgi:hypothetical protein